MLPKPKVITQYFGEICLLFIATIHLSRNRKCEATIRGQGA